MMNRKHVNLQRYLGVVCGKAIRPPSEFMIVFDHSFMYLYAYMALLFEVDKDYRLLSIGMCRSTSLI